MHKPNNEYFKRWPAVTNKTIEINRKFRSICPRCRPSNVSICFASPWSDKYAIQIFSPKHSLAYWFAFWSATVEACFNLKRRSLSERIIIHNLVTIHDSVLKPQLIPSGYYLDSFSGSEDFFISFLLKAQSRSAPGFPKCAYTKKLKPLAATTAWRACRTKLSIMKEAKVVRFDSVTRTETRLLSPPFQDTCSNVQLVTQQCMLRRQF